MNTGFYKVVTQNIPIRYNRELVEGDVVVYAGVHYSVMRVASPTRKSQILWQTYYRDLGDWIDKGLVEPLEKNEMYRLSPHISDNIRLAFRQYFQTLC